MPVKTAKKKSPSKKRITFQIEAEKGSNVYVAGTFNDWSTSKNKLNPKKGVFSTTVLLPKGSYEYKFVVNDTWCVDPKCPDWTSNGLGSINSCISVN